MVPDTLVGLVLFLGLIAPGLLYQLLWEGRHPALEESAFREASRTALTSLLFSGLACLVVIGLRAWQPNWVMDFGQYLRRPTYVADHYGLIVWTITLELALAFLFVLLFHYGPVLIAKLPEGATRWLPEFICPRSQYGAMKPGGIWYEVLRRKQPKGKGTWVSLRLSDGTQIHGYVAFYTPATTPETREIALICPSTEGGYIDISDPKLDPPERKLGKEWMYVVVRGDEITYMDVTYLR